MDYLFDRIPEKYLHWFFIVGGIFLLWICFITYPNIINPPNGFTLIEAKIFYYLLLFGGFGMFTCGVIELTKYKNPQISAIDKKDKITSLATWSTKVKERDNYQCQFCFTGKMSDLEAHHVVPRLRFPKIQYDLDNGITVCFDCHKIAEKVFKLIDRICIIKPK